MYNILTFKFIDTWSIISANKLYEPIKNEIETLNLLKRFIENIKNVKYEDSELNEKTYIDIFALTFKLIYGVIIKGGLLLIMAWLLNILLPTLLVTVSFGLIRVFSGGLHFKSYTLCTYISLASLLIGGAIGKYISYNIYINVIGLIISLICIILYAPVENKKLPIKPYRKPIFKRIAMLNIIFFFVINIFLQYTNIIFGILMAGIITLPIFNRK